MATSHITQFWTCTLVDSEVRINDRPFTHAYGLRFGEDWVEIETGLLHNDEMNVKQFLAPLRAARKIEVDIRAWCERTTLQQLLRVFCPVKLVEERCETRPFWHTQTDAGGVQNTEGKNAPAWYVVLRFEVLNEWAEESLPRALHATLVAAYKPGLSQEEIAEAIWANGPPWLRGSKFKATCEVLAFLLYTGVMQISPRK